MGHPVITFPTKPMPHRGFSQPRRLFSKNQALDSSRRGRHVRVLEPHLLKQFKTIRAHQSQGDVVCIDFLIHGRCDREACRFEHPKWDGHHLNCCVANLRGIPCHRGKTCQFAHIEDDGRIVVPVEETAYARRRLKQGPSPMCVSRYPPSRGGPSSHDRLSSHAMYRPERKVPAIKVSADEAPTWRVSPPQKPTTPVRLVKRPPPGLTMVPSQVTRKVIKHDIKNDMATAWSSGLNGLNPAAAPFLPSSSPPLPLVEPHAVATRKVENVKPREYSPLFMNQGFYTPLQQSPTTKTVVSLFSQDSPTSSHIDIQDVKPYTLFPTSPHPFQPLSFQNTHNSIHPARCSTCLGFDPVRIINTIL